MSDLKLYRILETFDELESAADKLTEYDSNAECYDCGSTISGHHTELCDLAGPAAIRDLPSRPGSQHWTGEVPAGLEDQVGTWDNTDVPDIDESQTKVQTMGDKVRVTTDGDTTEFDDADTAKEFMSADDEDNQFATEDLAGQGQEEIINYDDFELPNEPDSDMEIIDYKNFRPPVQNVEEGGLGADAWDVAADDIELDNYDDTDFSVTAEPPAEFGIDTDDWMVTDEATPGFDRQATKRRLNAHYQTLRDKSSSPHQKTNAQQQIDKLQRAMSLEDITETPVLEDDTEFSNFDSENESHRKRLQRGTPVVLDPELFSDPNVNRRGIFVSRSPSGHFGTVIRDLDGKEIKVHLSDIKSADLVNNSIYEEFELKFDDMLHEDITMTQTTNLENPENDTTTVTAIGPDSGEELAAMMANAGLNATNHGTMDMSPDEEVDTGEPAEMPMQDMMGMMDAPEVEEAFDDPDDGSDLFPTSDPTDIEPSDADLDSIESDPEWDLNLDEDVSSDLENVLTKFNDSDILAWLEAGNDELDDALYAISIEDMPYGTQKARTGDPSEWLHNRYYEEIADYAKDNFGAHLGEERDIEYTNTPGEQTAGVDAVLQGGGLNKPKRMYKPAGNRFGDNGMQRPMEGVDDWKQEHDDSGELPTDNRGFELGDDNDFDPMNVDEPTMKMVQTPDGPKWVAVGGEEADFDNDMSRRHDDNMIDVPYDNEYEPELDFNEELSPAMQTRKERDQEKIRVDRDMSTRSKDSRLTGHRRGTDKDDQSLKFGLGEQRSLADVFEEELAKETCPQCNGTSKENDESCSHCDSTGKVEKIEEKWNTDAKTPKSERGKYKGKTKAELESMLSKLKKSGPHKKGSPEFEKQNELEFALRAKNNWGKVKEDETNKFVNEHEDVDNFLSLYKAFSIRGEKK